MGTTSWDDVAQCWLLWQQNGRHRPCLFYWSPAPVVSWYPITLF